MITVIIPPHVCSKEVETPSCTTHFHRYIYIVKTYTCAHKHIQWKQILDFSSCLPRFTLEQIFTASYKVFLKEDQNGSVYICCTLYVQGRQERYSLIKTFMDFESKHSPRGLHMWEKMIFQPNTFSPEDPLAVLREQTPVSTEAPLIRTVKHSQETNKRTIPTLPLKTGTGMWFFSLIRKQNLSRIYEGRRWRSLHWGFSKLNHPHLFPHPENIFLCFPLHSPTLSTYPHSWSQNKPNICKRLGKKYTNVHPHCVNAFGPCLHFFESESWLRASGLRTSSHFALIPFCLVLGEC